MKTDVIDSDERLVEKAVHALFDELGPVDAARFLAIPKKRRMETVKRHRLWQAQLDEKEFLERILNSKWPNNAGKK